MLTHLLKELVAIARLCPDKGKIERVDELWLQAESLLVEARKELDTALPHLRQRRERPDPAYMSVVKTQGILKELDNHT